MFLFKLINIDLVLIRSNLIKNKSGLIIKMSTIGPCCVWDFRVSLLDDDDEACYLPEAVEDEDAGDDDQLLPEYRSQRDYLRKWLEENCKKWAFQLEAGNQDGYLHFQGRFSLKEKARKKQVLELFHSYADMVVPHYLEPTSKEIAKSKDMWYVLKVETRVRGPWTDKDTETFIPRQYEGFVERLRPYQKQILQLEEGLEINPRQVNLVIDVKGNMGKTVTAALAELLFGGVDVPPICDAKELIQIVCDIAISRNSRDLSPILIDLPRAVDKRKLGQVYVAIEQIKKGKLYDPRHKYKSWWINTPHVWVFTNEHPDLSLLSNDRWKLWSINDEYCLVPYEPPVLFESPEPEVDEVQEVKEVKQPSLRKGRRKVVTVKDYLSDSLVGSEEFVDKLMKIGLVRSSN